MTASFSFRRIFPAFVGLIVFLTITTLWLTGAHQKYATFFNLLGVSAFRFPFLDTHAVLAAIECHRLGIDVYAINPCDALGRLHVYAPLWLHLGALPITTAWTGRVGLGLDVSFLVSLVVLPPPRGPIGPLILAAAVVSPAVVYALERGNADLLMFLFAVLAGCLAMRSPWLRLSGQAVVVLAAALKYYPVTLMALALRERWPRCLAFTALSLAMLAACLLPEETDLMRALRLVPTGIGDTFGAMNIPVVLASGLGWHTGSRILLQAALTAWMALRALRWSHQLRPGLVRLSEPERVFLTAGATLIVGCFLTGQSAGYRAIDLLFVLPALLTLAGETGARLPRAAVALVLWAMWASALRTAPGVLDTLMWLVGQSAWWVLITVLSATLMALLRDSLALQSLGAVPNYVGTTRPHLSADGRQPIPP